MNASPVKGGRGGVGYPILPVHVVKGHSARTLSTYQHSLEFVRPLNILTFCRDECVYERRHDTRPRISKGLNDVWFSA